MRPRRPVHMICGLAFGLALFGTSAAAQEAGQARLMLKAVNQATLSSQIAAKIEELPYREGDRFEKGATLVAFNCQILRAHMNVANAILTGERKALENKRKLHKLQSAGELEVALAEAAVDKATGELAATKYAYDQCAIHAPFAGRVITRSVNRYETVAPGDPLLSILDDGRLEIELVIPSTWLSWLSVGDQFRVRIDETGTEHQAEILRLGAQIDPISQTTNAYAAFLDQSGAKQLVSGMSGTASFVFPGQ